MINLSLEWNFHKLEELINLRTGKLDSNAEEENGVYPFFTCAPDPLKINSFSFNQKAILLAGNNANGNFHINYYEGKFDAYQRTYVIDVLDNEKINLKYLYYALKICLNDFKRMSQGTSTRFLTKKILDNFEIQVPPIETQLKIVDVLDSITNKININQRINKNLTNIVLLLFKNWFVDFNFLNENNKPYKNDNGELKDSILGLIPKDWNVDSLGKYVEIDRGFSYKGKYLSEEGIPLINLGNILPNSEFRLEKLKFYSGEFDKKYKVNVGDILVANTDLTQNRLVLGSPIIVPSLIDEEDIIYSHHINRLSNFKLPKFYIFYNLLSERYNHMVSGYATGTTVLAISKESITNYKILIPPEELILKFDELAKNIEKIKDNNLIEMEKLTKLRNILLPKLMSGEIDVSQLDYLNNSIER